MTIPRRLSAGFGTVASPLYRRFRCTMSRFYGSVFSVQPQVDSDYYYTYYYDAELEQNHDRVCLDPVADTEGRRGVQWAFIGSPRSMKHVYAEMLSKLLEVPHISMATLVRQDLSPRSSLYKQVSHIHTLLSCVCVTVCVSFLHSDTY